MLKNITITLVLLISLALSSSAQFDIGYKLGLGISKPQILKKKREAITNTGIISPFLGLYVNLTMNKFVIEFGLESGQYKATNEFQSKGSSVLRTFKERLEINKLSIPFDIGILIKIHNIDFTPKIGLINTVFNSVNYSSSFSDIFDGVSTITTFSKPYNYYQDFSLLLNYEFYLKLDIGLTDKLSLGTSVIFREKSELDFQGSPFGRRINDFYFQRDYRFFVSYKL